MKKDKSFILGAGITGLSVGYISGLTVYEASSISGGICTSYYIKPNSSRRFFSCPSDENVYHFETGGGHWIFGGDDKIKSFINKLAPYKTYKRRSSVYLSNRSVFIPYPLQNNLAFLDKKTSRKALQEILKPKKNKVKTMKDWIEARFGKNLCKLFFDPFHELYTAGLYSRVAPQDSYKTPIDKDEVIKGYNGKGSSVGYNVSFIYPRKGLDKLTKKLGEKCKIKYNKEVVKIDLKEKKVFFSDKTYQIFNKLISTLPLNKMAKLCKINVAEKSFPSPSVLVINIGAEKGSLCPNDHWVYISKSKSGFHRVGFYSNVDPIFLPKKNREKNDRVSVYVEKAYPENTKLTKEELDKISKQVVAELKEWKWIGNTEVVDPTWIATAYTWSWPNSKWKTKVLNKLEESGIIQVGRYGRWVFQGIADSIKDGLELGYKLK